MNTLDNVSDFNLRTLNNTEPHPDYKGWRGFLKTCELRGESKDGVQYYGKTNCNYILFPLGTIITNFGFHGESLLNVVNKQGWQRTLQEIVDARNELIKLLEGGNGEIKSKTPITPHLLPSLRAMKISGENR